MKRPKLRLVPPCPPARRPARVTRELVLDLPRRYGDLGLTWDRTVPRDLVSAQVAGLHAAYLDARLVDAAPYERRSIWLRALALAGRLAA